MNTIRRARSVTPSKPTVEGAGVQLRRAFGSGQEKMFDPFLMLDDFRCDSPSQFAAGFPWHPHRGIETVTYVLEGEIDHADSLGNQGTIGPGDVQWMTAGSGILHQEMPRGDANGRMGGFQLWANLPAGQKMTEPRYRGVVSANIPVDITRGARVRVISGKIGRSAGPVRDIAIQPEYLDVTLQPEITWTHVTPYEHTVFAYLFEGAALFGESGGRTAAGNGTTILLTPGDMVSVTAGPSGARFLLVSGKPLAEPIAWQGPIVMNTQEQLATAWRELEDGTFVKQKVG
jgi:redox-sensitive bicupin YhaK (pirin superfamily)